MKIPKIEIDRVEFYLVMGVVFCFVGASFYSIALAFLLVGVILLLVFFNSLSAATKRAKVTGNEPTNSN